MLFLYWCTLQRNHRFPNKIALRAQHNSSPVERAQLFAPSYGEFVLQKPVPTIEQVCGSVDGFCNNYDIRLSMMNCSDDYGYHDWDNLVFCYRDGVVTRTDYNPGTQARESMPAELIAALTLPPILGRVERLRGEVGPFKLYPSDDPYCHGAIAHVDAVFDSTVRDRDNGLVQ